MGQSESTLNIKRSLAQIKTSANAELLNHLLSVDIPQFYDTFTIEDAQQFSLESLLFTVDNCFTKLLKFIDSTLELTVEEELQCRNSLQIITRLVPVAYSKGVELQLPVDTLIQMFSCNLVGNQLVWSRGIGNYEEERSSSSSAIVESVDIDQFKELILTMALVVSSSEVYGIADDDTSILHQILYEPVYGGDVNEGKKKILAMLCSLLNLAVNSGGSNNNRKKLQALSLQLLNVWFNYKRHYQIDLQSGTIRNQNYDRQTGSEIKLDEIKNANLIRLFYGRLHRADDFQIILDGIVRLCMDVNVNKDDDVLQQTVMFIFNLLIYNEKFTTYFCCNPQSAEVIQRLLWILVKYGSEQRYSGMTRNVLYVLHYFSDQSALQTLLSVDTFTIMKDLQQMTTDYTLSDTVLVSLITFCLQCKNPNFTSISLCIMRNIGPMAEVANLITCQKLVNLIMQFSKPSYLSANLTSIVYVIDLVQFVLQQSDPMNSVLLYELLTIADQLEALQSISFADLACKASAVTVGEAEFDIFKKRLAIGPLVELISKCKYTVEQMCESESGHDQILDYLSTQKVSQGLTYSAVSLHVGSITQWLGSHTWGSIYMYHLHTLPQYWPTDNIKLFSIKFD
ncbi:hypothetical protein MIR68_009934 [Amoeboaphelidium protococcarum]|nr:hypothetical protein MIR68_009934 [Amoeboaphelidium protococcarum]